MVSRSEAVDIYIKCIMNNKGIEKSKSILIKFISCLMNWVENVIHL